MNNDTIITIDEILQSYDKPLPDQKEFTKEELEVIAEFDEFEANVRKNYVPIPQRKNYLLRSSKFFFAYLYRRSSG